MFKMLRIAALFAALVSPALADPPDPYVWPNGINTIVQEANPGPGADAGQYGANENIFFFDTDGGYLLGPGARPDISGMVMGFFNLYAIHEHVRFNQPAYSATRPEARLVFYPLGGGWFNIEKLTYGGTLRVSTGTPAGGGGTVTMDYLPFQILPGQQMAWFLYPHYVGNQYFEIGWQIDANNKVFFQRSEPTGSEAVWSCQAVVGGASTYASSTAVMTGNGRRIMILYYRWGVGVEFYIGNYNNTAVKVCTIPIAQLPSSGPLAYSYVKFYNLGASINRILYITNWYARLLP